MTSETASPWALRGMKGAVGRRGRVPAGRGPVRGFRSALGSPGDTESGRASLYPVISLVPTLVPVALADASNWPSTAVVHLSAIRDLLDSLPGPGRFTTVLQSLRCWRRCRPVSSHVPETLVQVLGLAGSRSGALPADV